MEFDPDNVRIYVEEKERAEWYRHLNALAQVPQSNVRYDCTQQSVGVGSEA